jgi:replicative DNA helicase
MKEAANDCGFCVRRLEAHHERASLLASRGAVSHRGRLRHPQAPAHLASNGSTGWRERGEAARGGKRVGLFSREMSKDELRLRLLNMAQINLFDLMRGEITPVERLEAEDAKRDLEDIPLFLDDRSKTVAEIRRQAEVSRYDLVAIDFLGLLLPPGRHENRNAEVSAMSREVKLMAQELAIPVLALHQLSREVEKRADQRPIMSDLRDSGSLEQDADLVTFLSDRAITTGKNRNSSNSAEFIVAKQRNGPTGCGPLEFHGSFAAFADAPAVAAGASI